MLLTPWLKMEQQASSFWRLKTGLEAESTVLPSMETGLNWELSGSTDEEKIRFGSLSRKIRFCFDYMSVLCLMSYILSGLIYVKFWSILKTFFFCVGKKARVFSLADINSRLVLLMSLLKAKSQLLKWSN
jgi:hypothetical protein